VSLTFNSTPNPSMLGDTVTFGLGIMNAIGESVTGSVAFFDGADPLAGCSEPIQLLDDWTYVECSTALLAAGTHQVKAVYMPPDAYSIYAETEANLEQVVTEPVVITVGPATIAQGHVSVAYSQQFTASGGTGPYTFATTSTLPDGISLIGDTLSGTPTAEGDFSITITATDNNGVSGSGTYTLTIAPTPPITIMPEVLPEGILGVEYLTQLTAVNGTEPYTFSLYDGNLPDGLSLSGDTISGTPELTGTWSFTIQVTDSSSPVKIASRDYTIEVTALTIGGTLFTDTDRDGVLDSGEVGIQNMHVAFDQGCDGSLDYGEDSDAQGSYAFVDLAVNQKYCINAMPVPGYTRTTQPVTIDSLPASMTGVDFGYVTNSLIVSPTEIPNPVLKKSYSTSVTVSGGTAPYTFTELVALLPEGLSYSFATTGVLTISGTARALGPGTVSVLVKDANQDEALIDLNFAVMGDVTLTLTSDNNPSMQSQAVTFSLAVAAPTGGQFPAPQGEVSFSDGDSHIFDCIGLQLGVEEGELNPVTCTTSTLSPGTHTILAEYSDRSGAYRDTYTTMEQVVNADTTPPVITYTIDGTKGQNDWYTTDVTLTWTVTDPDTAITSQVGCDPVTITGDQGKTDYTCTATSGGGENSVTVTIGRDTIAPSITLTADRAPDVSGWYNHAINFTVEGTDATSGIASCNSNFTYSNPDSATAALNRTCTDNAGNVGTSETFNFQYDATKPVVTVTGVTEGSVYVQGSVPVAGCTTTDALAGVLIQATISITGGDPDGLGNFTATCSGALDEAGNEGDPVVVNYTVVSPSYYTFKIDVTTNGADGLTILVGAPVTWQYVVTNVSSSNLTNIVVTDNILGQVCKLNRLAPQSSKTCTKTGVAVAGPYTNTGTATVVSGGTTYTASDDSSYFGAAPAIDVEKLVSVDLGATWQDADSPTGPNAIVGDPVQFKFVITNTGNIDLSNITLSDTDMSLPACSTPTTLAAGSSYECVVETPATIGQHTNTATATGVYGGITYTDIDNGNYHGGNAIEPRIAINSLTININKARTTVSGQFIVTDETKDGTTPDGFLVDLTDYGLDWEAKAAKATAFARVVPSGCTYTVVAVDHEQAPGWHSGDPIAFDESVTIGYTCTFGSTQLPAGGTLRGTAWAYIFDLMDMKYTYIATKTIPK
jgi:hypothetical protein